MEDATRAILDRLLAAARADPLQLPDLQEWVAAFGGYAQIPPAAWAEWDRLYEESKTPPIRTPKLNSAVVEIEGRSPAI
jgi:hypothetical protein